MTNDTDNLFQYKIYEPVNPSGVVVLIQAHDPKEAIKYYVEGRKLNPTDRCHPNFGGKEIKAVAVVSDNRFELYTLRFGEGEDGKHFDSFRVYTTADESFTMAQEK